MLATTAVSYGGDRGGYGMTPSSPVYTEVKFLMIQERVWDLHWRLFMWMTFCWHHPPLRLRRESCPSSQVWFLQRPLGR